jgi:hypothetical protein
MGEFVALVIGCVVISLFLWGMVSGYKSGSPTAQLPRGGQWARGPRRAPGPPPLVYPVPGAKSDPDLPRATGRIRIVRTDPRCPACRQLLLDGQPTARCTRDASHRVHRHCVAMMQGKCPQCKNQLS